MYLYVPKDDLDCWQSDVAPDEDQADQVIQGDLQVFRLGPGSKFEIYEPIQADDQDSWGEVRPERK